LSRASATENQAARSSSGNVCRRPGLRRPFHLEHVAFEIFGIPVLFDGQDANQLASRLLCLAKRNWLAARAVTRLFREFAFRGGEGLFPGDDQSFRNAPGTEIFTSPERSSGLTKKNFDAVAVSPIQEKPGALFGRRHYRTLCRAVGDASFPLQVPHELGQFHGIEHTVGGDAAFAGHLDTPAHVIELPDRVGVRD
jgi:hypothetical protein